MTIPTKRIEPVAVHKQFRDDLIALLRKHSGELDSSVMLAMASHLVGQLVAMQDQRKMTPGMAMELVAVNIETGNAEVLKGISVPLGQG